MVKGLAAAACSQPVQFWRFSAQKKRNFLISTIERKITTCVWSKRQINCDNRPAHIWGYTAFEAITIVYTRGGEPIYYHGPHKLWIIAGGTQITIDFILTFYLYLSTRDRASYDILSWVIEVSDLLSKYLLITELRFDAILYSKLGNENSDAGRIKYSRGRHLSCGPQVPHPWFIQWWDSNFFKTGSLTIGLINNRFSHYHSLQLKSYQLQ